MEVLQCLERFIFMYKCAAIQAFSCYIHVCICRLYRACTYERLVKLY
jgi:hypothetical protein